MTTTTRSPATPPQTTTIKSLDYKSQQVIDARLKEMMLRVEEKTKSDLDTDSLLRSCHALIAGITTKAEFRNMKLFHVDQSVFQKNSGTAAVQRPSTSQLESLLNPWLELAFYAYEYHDDGMPLEGKISDLLGGEPWILIRHSTDLETGGVGYYIAANTQRKKLLIGIKGTSTMSDLITDCLATTIPHRCIPHSPFGDNDDKSEHMEIGAHEGILASSIRVCEELKPILDDKLPQGYSVDLVGHSLGAGVASVLAVLLRAQYRELHDLSRLHAYCFATPPVLDFQAATKSKPFITAVVNRSDAVSRMAIANVEVLIRMLEGLNNIILKREGLLSFWTIARETMFGEKIKQLDHDQFAELLEIMYQAQAAVQIEHKEHLYVPGNVIALYGTLEQLPEKGQEADVTIKCAWVDPAHTFLRYFEVNERMFNDHYIPAYRESLSACIESRKQSEVVPARSCGDYCCACCLCDIVFCDRVCCCTCRAVKNQQRRQQKQLQIDDRGDDVKEGTTAVASTNPMERQ